MAEEETAAEAAFFRMQQAMNEEAKHQVALGSEEIQIESSEDEYDPEKDMHTMPFDQRDSFDDSHDPSLLQVSHQPSNDGSFNPSHSSMYNIKQKSASPIPESDVDVRRARTRASKRSTPEVSQATNGSPKQKTEAGSSSPLQSPPSRDETLRTGADAVSAPSEIPITSVTVDALSEPASHATNIHEKSPAASKLANIQTIKSPPHEGKETLSTPLSASLPKARLPHDKVGLFEDRIKEDPRGDVDAWISLVTEHRRRGKVDDARKVYERFFVVFPSAAEQWVAYIQMENEIDNRVAVEVIFSSTLTAIPNLQLWSTYINHVRRHFNVTTDPNARQIIFQAYDLALKHVGIDRDSGDLWQDYIQFIKSGPGVVGGNNWQDQQKMDQLRKTYQAAIRVPTQAVDSIWKEYSAFETGLNKVTGRRFLQDQSKIFVTSKSTNTDMRNRTRGLNRTTLPVLPPALGFQGDVEYMHQVELWKIWIDFEKEDPLVLKDEDTVAFNDRVVYVYKQALIALRFWPEMWFDAAQFCLENGLDEDGREFLSKGVVANPESCLLAFKLGDHLELTSTSDNTEESLNLRGKLVREPYDKLLDALYDLINKTTAREAEQISRIEAQFREQGAEKSNGTSGRDSEDDEQAEEERKRQVEQQKNQQFEMVKNSTEMQNRLTQKTLSGAWIALMRAMRRIQGKGRQNGAVGGSRQVLAEARKRGRILSDVYLATAMLEFHMGETEACKRIFDRGAKLFPEDEVFALEYIKHLTSANNDLTNARVIFETTVGRLAAKLETKQRAKPLYAFFYAFESQHGELASIVKFEKRMAETFPDDPRLSSFSRRFTSTVDNFDSTVIRPIISPGTQARPKMMIPSVEQQAPPPQPPAPQPIPPQQFPLEVLKSPTPQPQQAYVPPSPKRPLPIDDDVLDRPRKLARGESPMGPLKGAAGRKLDQQRRQHHQNNGSDDYGRGYNQPSRFDAPPQFKIPSMVNFLLTQLPKRETLGGGVGISAAGLTRVLRDLHVPQDESQIRWRGWHPAAQNQGGQAMGYGGYQPPPQQQFQQQGYYQHQQQPPPQQYSGGYGRNGYGQQGGGVHQNQGYGQYR